MSHDAFQKKELIFYDLDLFYTFDVLLNGVSICQLYHDCEDRSTPWVVIIGEQELYRGSTYLEAKMWIEEVFLCVEG